MTLAMSLAIMTITAEEARDMYFALEVAVECCESALKNESDPKELADVLDAKARYDAIMKRLAERFDIFGAEG